MLAEKLLLTAGVAIGAPFSIRRLALSPFRMCIGVQDRHLIWPPVPPNDAAAPGPSANVRGGRVQRRFPCLRYPALLIRPQGSLCVDRNRNQDACLRVDPGDGIRTPGKTLSRGSRASSATWASTSDSMVRRRTRNPGPVLAVLGLVGAREFRQGRLHVFSSPPREDSNATLRSGDILDRLLCRGGAPMLWGRD
jgi:hypothetical protein